MLSIIVVIPDGTFKMNTTEKQKPLMKVYPDYRAFKCIELVLVVYHEVFCSPLFFERTRVTSMRCLFNSNYTAPVRLPTTVNVLIVLQYY